MSLRVGSLVVAREALGAQIPIGCPGKVVNRDVDPILPGDWVVEFSIRGGGTTTIACDRREIAQRPNPKKSQKKEDRCSERSSG